MNRPHHIDRRTALAAITAMLTGAGCATTPKPLGDSELPRLRQARFVLLGEVHDNASQHLMRAALLSELLADGRPSCVVFEQMDRAENAAIAAAPRDAESIATAGKLDRRGWQWPLHRPLIDAALGASARIAGGNLRTDEVRAIVRGGTSALPADLRSALADQGWSQEQQAAMEREIDDGHCHALPSSQWPAMALGQRARDAALALSLLDAAAGDGRAVLIAGNGHVRRDLGVPFYLRAAGVPAVQIVSVGYVETAEKAAPYDIVRVTGGVAGRPDPCAAFGT
jgi:uncharacterized iron-regulated protein